MLRAIFLFTLLGSAAMLFIGCSGTAPGTSAMKGMAQLTIHWPDRTRMIPIAANTIKITILQGTTIIATQAVDRPTTGTTSPVVFNNLPLGQISAMAAAFASNDTSATPLATGTAPLLISADLETTFSIRLGSTITSLRVTPATNTLQVGQSSALAATAYAGTDLVLVTNASLQWKAIIAPGTIATGAVATVDSTGMVTAVAPGAAIVTVTDSESGASASAAITVLSPTIVAITPGTLTVQSGGTADFSASVTGGAVSDPTVIWSIQEGNFGGTISASGHYVAPGTPGTYHVLAAWATDPSKSASATVTVTAAAIPTVTVTVSPATISLSVQDSQTFTATVTGSTNQAVTWQMQESWGGTLSSSGAYTAPSIAGTYHVIATSVADPTVSAIATVTVASGGSSWTIE